LLRARPNIPALIGVLLVVPLVAAAGLAWACVPTARVALSKNSGPGNVTITMSGSGFPAATTVIDIYLDNKTGAPVKDDVQVSGGDEKAFSTTVTVPDTVGAHLLIPVPRDSNGADIGTTSQGAGPPAAVYQVTDPVLAAAPGAARAGTSVTVTGGNFRFGTVDLHWDSASGPKIGSVQTNNAFGFSKQVTIPSSTAGAHSIVGVPLGDPADSASVAVTVLPPLPAFVPAPDSVGPAIAAAALTSGNGTKRVSRTGAVTIFCGDYDEGVTGECSATSAKKIKVAGASKLLKLGKKSFSAGPGKPARIKFRLKKSGMKMLKKAKKVRMRGTVTARDSKGNTSPAAKFSFTLKAPKPRKR
jgi:hypothetical protein